jgi:hypothetical protein
MMWRAFAFGSLMESVSEKTSRDENVRMEPEYVQEHISAGY